MIKIGLVNIVKNARKRNASDIHFTLIESDDVLTQLCVGNIMLPRSQIDRKESEKNLAYHM